MTFLNYFTVTFVHPDDVHRQLLQPREREFVQCDEEAANKGLLQLFLETLETGKVRNSQKRKVA